MSDEEIIVDLETTGLSADGNTAAEEITNPFESIGSVDVVADLVQPYADSAIFGAISHSGHRPSPFHKKLPPNFFGEEERKEPEVPPPPTFVVIIGEWHGVDNTEQQFKEITEEELLPVVGKNIVLTVPNGESESHTEEDIFKVYLYSSSMDQNTDVTAPQYLWDRFVSSRNNCFLSSGQGISIIEETSGYEVAELTHNSLYIHNDITNYNDIYTYNLYRHILRKAVELLKKGYDKAFEEYKSGITQNAKDLYVDMCHNRISSVTKKLEDEHTALGRKIQRVSDNLIEYTREQELIRTQLNSLRETPTQNPASFEKEFDKLLTVKGVRDVYMLGKWLCVETGKIYIKFNDSNIYMGRYLIRFRIGASATGINITNLVESKVMYGYPHPHISKNGHPCFGNMGVGLMKLMAAYEYSVAIQMIIKYLQSVNPDDTIRSISNWL